MRVGHLDKIGQVSILERPVPQVDEGEVLIEVAYAGVCGSDLHSFKGTHPFREAPVVLGHELSGTIARLGTGVTGLAEGDRVTVMPYVHCGACIYCQRGHTNVCENKLVPGQQWSGTFADYFWAKASVTYRLGDHTSLRAGALTEPLAVGIHAVARARIQPDSHVLVLGGGTIGLMSVAGARLAGARRVAVTDLFEHNLGVAAELGADHAYDALQEGMVELIRSDYPQGFDAIVLASGAGITMAQALALAQRGARIVVVAMFTKPVPMNLLDVTIPEVEVLGSQIYTDADFRAALDALDTGALPLEAIISHELQLEQAQEALMMLAERRGNPIKILLKP